MLYYRNYLNLTYIYPKIKIKYKFAVVYKLGITDFLVHAIIRQMAGHRGPVWYFLFSEQFSHSVPYTKNNKTSTATYDGL